MMKQSLLWNERFINQNSISENDEVDDSIDHVSYWT